MGVIVGGGEGGVGWFRFLFGAIVNEIEGFCEKGYESIPSIPLPDVRSGFLRSGSRRGYSLLLEYWPVMFFYFGCKPAMVCVQRSAANESAKRSLE